MMRRLMILGLLLCSMAAMAQQDRVYLKNGSLLKGQILEIDTRHLQIDIGEAEALQLSLNKLQAIRLKRKKTALSAQDQLSIDSLNRAFKLNKWVHQVRVGVLNGEDGNTLSTATNFTFDYTLFYPVKSSLYLGLSVGYSEYPAFRVIPISVELRKDWGIGPSPFFAYFKAGMSRAGSRNDLGGWAARVRGQEFFAFGLGQQWSIGRKAMLFTVGFRKQALQTSWSAGDFRSVTDWNLNRLELKLGMVF